MKKYKLEVEGEIADSVFVEFLRDEAETAWHALNYTREIKEPKDWQLEDLWYNYNLLGAMYLVEEYFSAEPILRDKYPREEIKE